MKQFDAKRAELVLKDVFLTQEIQEELHTNKDEIESIVEATVIEHIQMERLKHFPEVKKLKASLEEMFPSYRFTARVKSLSSIFGKMLKHRTVADYFGFKIIVPTIEECYYVKSWLCEHFWEIDFEDKILNPKKNGYRDLQLVVIYEDFLAEFIIQTTQMYVDSRTIQSHELVYPWKYHDKVRSLPVEYQQIKF